ncbi:MFS transporter [Parageobacillus thermoglucosidasius]|uniref:MFS transporter n=1 Tax=Parageobacillus thermoglucosidasius TaxID=1426 RepID=UPI0001D18C46|nr:MFS transporter [Parageobacillus thermoglucosidasius]AEH46675.1 major facilitator superfamily MFS_1 [Parageobacillus thermoglucosidasius C56-YS93]
MSKSNMDLLEKNSYKWLVLALATYSQASATFVTYGVAPLAALWQQDYGLSQFQTGVLVSAVNLGPIFSMLFIGDALDKYGERWLIGVGSALLGLTMLLASFTNNYIALVIILGFVGVWYGTAQPGGSKVIIKWFPKSQRGLAMGIRQTGIPIGGAVAAALLPGIYLRFGSSFAVLTQTVLSVLGGILFSLLYRDQSITKINNGSNRTFKEKLITIFKNKRLHPIFLVGITMISLQMILVAHLMVFLAEKLTISISFSGKILSIVLIAGMIGRVVIAWVSDWLWKGNRTIPLTICVWCAILGLIMLLFLSNDWSIWVTIILCAWLGFFGIGWFSLFIVEVSERASEDSIGLTVSFALTLNQFAIVLAPALFGFLVDWQGSYYTAWICLIILISISGFWLMFHLPSRKKQQIT